MESYIGLVEVGVGLVPGGGGLTYIARRAAEKAARRQRERATCCTFLTDGFTSAAMAKVGTSAIESRKLGYLLDERRRSCRTRTSCCTSRMQQAQGDGDERLPRRRAKRPFPVAGRSGDRDDQGVSSSTCATAASSARTTSTSRR